MLGHKAARVAAVAAMTVGTLASTTAAHASTTTPTAIERAGCPGDGHLDRGYSCTSLDNGALFHRKFTNDKAETFYKKTSGSATNIKLGINAGSGNDYRDPVRISSDQTKSATWNNINWCRTSLGLMLAGGRSYQTPPTDCNT